MRRVLAIITIAIVTALIDYVISAMSIASSGLPPAHYAAWMRLLEGTCASKLQLDVVNAAMQWYGGPVVIGVAGFIVGLGATLLGIQRSGAVVGVAAFAVVKGVAGGVLQAPTVFSVFFALVCAGGGCAFGSIVIRAYQQLFGRLDANNDL